MEWKNGELHYSTFQKIQLVIDKVVKHTSLRILLGKSLLKKASRAKMDSRKKKKTNNLVRIGKR